MFNAVIYESHLVRLQVCRILRILINDTMSLQYKVELAAAGMIDGDISISLADRLARLRQYVAGKESTQMTHYLTLDFHSQCWIRNSNVFMYKERDCINIVRLPSESQGIHERRWVVQQSRFPGHMVIACAVDFTQDLIVILRTLEQVGEYVH